MYNLNPALYGSVFVVPKDLVEKYIKLASFCAVKSLLWILNNQGGNFSLSDVAKGIGSSEADVKEALDYWVNEGVLAVDGKLSDNDASVKSDSYLLNEEKDKPSPPPEAKKEKAEFDDKLITPTDELVNNRIADDKDFANLIQQIDFMLGRSTGYDTHAKILQMVDGYGFPVEIILTLIQYCVDIGKPSNAFILSVAKNWYNHEIMTIEQAHEYIRSHSEAQKIYNEFRMQTGLSAPRATPKQEEYFVRWSGFEMSVEMMVYAYNITIENTGKISFAYMDKIISSWHEKEFKTPEDVEKSKQTGQKSAPSQSSYDIEKTISDDAEKKIVYKKKKKGGA